MNGNILYQIKYGGSPIIEIIVKYNGNIDRIANEVGASAEVLSNSFAILNISVNEIINLSKYNEIIYIELPKTLRLFLDEAITDSCIRLEGSNVGGLNGSGVLIGIIDSGINKNIGFYNKVKYLLELNTNPDISHGTMVASVINSIAPQADIAFVSIGRNDFFASDTDIMRGIKFIADSAKGGPFVINISYGTNSGPHNGNTLFEEYIDEVAQNYKCSIVIASGNEGDKGRHYRGNFNEGRAIEFNIEKDLNSVILELWKGFVDIANYEIISPSGDRSGIISAETEEISLILGNTQIFFIFTQPSPYNVLEQVYIRFEGADNINSGIWRLIVYPQNIVEGEFNIWSNQAIFLEPEIATTLTIPSTARRAITVGAYNSYTNSQAAFSGRGFTSDGAVKPDIAAPGVNVIINNTSNTGTSVAAPFVSGCCALLMEWGIVQRNDINMYGERLKAYLRLGAIRDNMEYPNRVFGYGRLCLRNTYNHLTSYKITQLQDNPIYSNIYEEIVLPTTPQLINSLEENNILYCSIGSYTAIYFRRNDPNFTDIFNRVSDFLRGNMPILLGLMSEEYNIAAGIERVHRPPLNLRGNNVIVGFVDTGINYNNPEFIYENGENKIYSIWDMTVEDEVSDNVCFGRVFNNEEINNNTADTRDEIGHGTAMAIQACGNSGAAPDSTIIAVKLKRAKTYLYDNEFVPYDATAYSSVDVMLGIDYIAREAESLQKPYVIILGLGTNNGGHNGSSILERYISSLGQNAGTIIAVPAGNEATARHHTSFDIDNDRGYYDIEINVAENVKGFNMWIWNNILDKTEISIISPIGETIPRITAQPNFTNEYNLFQTNTIINVAYDMPVYQTTDQRTALSFNNPLGGVWRIRVYGSSLYSKIHAWLPISQFVGSRVVFTEPDSYTTVTIPSTADNIMCVGGYSVNENTVLPQSGRGPDRRGRLRPDFIAPTNTDTSIAASVAGGAAALLLQWGIINGNFYSLNSTTATALIINAAKQSPNEVYPNNIAGYGLIDLYNVFFRL